MKKWVWHSSHFNSILYCWNLGNASGLQHSGKLFPGDIACGAGEIKVAKLKEGRGGFIGWQGGE